MAQLPSWFLPVAVLVIGIVITIFVNYVTQNHKIKTAIALPILLCSIGVAIFLVVQQSPQPSGGGDRPSASPEPTVSGIPPAGWKLVVAQGFDHPDGPAISDSHDGCTNSTGIYTHGTLQLRVDSCRDHTLQTAITSSPEDFGTSYFVTADVEFTSGPTDGYCALLIGWRDNEHYYAFKVNRATFEITRDKGGLPHEGVDGPRLDPALRPAQSNHIAVWSNADSTKFVINGVDVSHPPGLVAKDGQIRLGVQAANRSDLVTCTFDNVEIWTP